MTDNERTVSLDHIAGVAVRHPEIVAVGRHYGMTIRTCAPADPQSKGGSEAFPRVGRVGVVTLPLGVVAFVALQRLSADRPPTWDVTP